MPHARNREICFDTRPHRHVRQTSCPTRWSSLPRCPSCVQTRSPHRLCFSWACRRSCLSPARPGEQACCKLLPAIYPTQSSGIVSNILLFVLGNKDAWALEHLKTFSVVNIDINKMYTLGRFKQKHQNCIRAILDCHYQWVLGGETAETDNDCFDSKSVTMDGLALLKICEINHI